MGCSIYRWRKHTAASSNPKGAVMAVGDGGRPAGMEEPTTHESHNVLQRSQDSTRPAERSRERSQSCGYDSGWKGQCRAITSEWISSSSNLCDLLQCHRRILGFYHLLCFPFHTLCFSFLFFYIRFCFTTVSVLEITSFYQGSQVPFIAYLL